MSIIYMLMSGPTYLKDVYLRAKLVITVNMMLCLKKWLLPPLL